MADPIDIANDKLRRAIAAKLLAYGAVGRKRSEATDADMTALIEDAILEQLGFGYDALLFLHEHGHV